MLELDTYIGEAKYENAISRLSAVANPRQIERVPAGAEFSFALVYNIEREDELEEDMKTLADGFRLLMMDYIGGHGSRGYGRISFGAFEIEVFSLNEEVQAALQSKAEGLVSHLNGSC